MALELTPNVRVTTDEAGTVRILDHVLQPFEADAQSPLDLSMTYLAEASEVFGIDAEIVGPQESPKEAFDERSILVATEEKSLMGATTVAFAQHFAGIQVWEAGVSVLVEEDPQRVLSAQSEYRRAIKTDLLDRLREHDWRERFGPEWVAEALGIGDPAKFAFDLNGEGKLWLYRFERALRHHPESNPRRIQSEGRQLGPPTLELPSLDETFREGVHYPVVETLFTLALPAWDELHWRALIEPTTGAVLYVRAFTSCATGHVYRTDPTVQSGNLSLRANAATTADLDAQRSSLTLAGLDPPAGGQQALRGEFVVVQDTNAPTVTPPTEPSPHVFDYSSPTDNFAAVATYHHCDATFRLVQSLGFTVTTYFDNTTFPVPVDHRGMTGVNAQCPGNAAGNGVGRMIFGPCDVGTTVGMGSEGRTVWHEFGHALLWDSVNSPNFGFAHSAGDALAMIVTDPHTAITGADRFIVFTFCPLTTHRRADRDVTAGWAWGGSRDIGGYSSEEILCTTLFRFYRSLGGDSTRQDAQEFASRYSSYLIIRAIGSLATSPVTPTPNAAAFATPLMTADRLTTSFEGHSGGTMHKVMRWAFEKQGLYQPPGAATPVTSPGAPPDVDVYIDDGRNGEYQWRENFWDTTDIWNRVADDGGTTHEHPIVDETNFVYVRVKNRGRLQADNVAVRGFHCRPLTGLVWPADWQPMTTAQLTAGSIPSGGSTIVGPFEWTPHTVGHECLLMIVSADGDPSVVDAVGGSVSGTVPHWRLVPFDNNIAQRNVSPVSGSRGSGRMIEELAERGFEIRNTLGDKAVVEVKWRIPRLLARLGWTLELEGIEKQRFVLGPEEGVEVRPIMVPGEDVDDATLMEMAESPKGSRIDVDVLMNGDLVGGMTFKIDPGQEEDSPKG